MHILLSIVVLLNTLNMSALTTFRSMRALRTLSLGTVVFIDTLRVISFQGHERERKLERSVLSARSSLDVVCLRERETSSKVGRSLGFLDMHCLPSLHKWSKAQLQVFILAKLSVEHQHFHAN